MIISKAIHVAANGNILFFLWLNNIPYHIFFIYSSIDGHLGCFLALATENSIALNTGVHVSFQIRVSSFLGVGYMDHMVVLVLVF